MFVVRCQVSGGVTGTKTGTLRRGETICLFESREEAQEQADGLNQINQRHNDSPFRTCEFRYWVEPVASA
jgi:hypothetical protein